MNSFAEKLCEIFKKDELLDIAKRLHDPDVRRNWRKAEVAEEISLYNPQRLAKTLDHWELGKLLTPLREHGLWLPLTKQKRAKQLYRLVATFRLIDYIFDHQDSVEKMLHWIRQEERRREPHWSLVYSYLCYEDEYEDEDDEFEDQDELEELVRHFEDCAQKPWPSSIALKAQVGRFRRSDSFRPSAKASCLLVGNALYRGSRKLHTPKEDATQLGKVLSNAGHTVRVVHDATLPVVEKELTRLARQLDKGNGALFFFSGHGGTENGESVLEMIESPGLKNPLLRVSQVLECLQSAAFRVIILDACRSFTESGRGVKRSILSMEDIEKRIKDGAYGGSLGQTAILYATSPNREAYDGLPGGVSPFTGDLISSIESRKRLNLDTLHKLCKRNFDARNSGQAGRYGGDPELSTFFSKNWYIVYKK